MTVIMKIKSKFIQEFRFQVGAFFSAFGREPASHSSGRRPPMAALLPVEYLAGIGQKPCA
jgi:hypothetical protein